MAHETSKRLKISLRVLSALSAIIGAGFIIWACVIQTPPKSALPIGFIILGSLAVIVAVIGIFHSMCGRCCLNIFLLFATLVTIGEFAIVITLFANLDGNVQNLLNYQIAHANAANTTTPVATPAPVVPIDPLVTDPAAPVLPTKKSGRVLFAKLTAQQVAWEEEIRSDLEIGRYVFLVFVIFEFIALMVTIVLRVKYPYKSEGDELDDKKAARSAMAQIQMESLKSSVGNKSAPGPEGGNFYTASNKMYRNVTKKMSEKYGEFTQDPAFHRKWWQNIPGLK